MIEVLYFTKTPDSKSKVVAEFGIKIHEWDLSLMKMKVIQSLNGHLFVVPPSYKVGDEYKDYWFFGKETNKRFLVEVMKSLKKYMDMNEPVTAESEKKEEPLFLI